MAPRVPAVEIPDDAHRAGIRGPDGEMDAPIPVELDEVTSQLLVQTRMGSLVEQMDIRVAQQAEGGAIRSQRLLRFSIDTGWVASLSRR